MKLKKNIATSDEGFLFNPTTGDSFSTNSIGAEIILLLKKNDSLHNITEFICNKYDVDKILLNRDLEDFVQQLKEYSIVE